MGEILELFVPWAVSLLAIFALLGWDESRLSPTQLSRAWPPATRTLAVVVFGAIALPVHFGRTRSSLGGVVQGTAWAGAITALDYLVGWGVEEFSRRVLPT